MFRINIYKKFAFIPVCHVLTLKENKDKAINKTDQLKGSDRICKVVKLNMKCCGKILYDSFETYKTFPQCIIT